MRPGDGAGVRRLPRANRSAQAQLLHSQRAISSFHRAKEAPAQLGVGPSQKPRSLIRGSIVRAGRLRPATTHDEAAEAEGAHPAAEQPRRRQPLRRQHVRRDQSTPEARHGAAPAALAADVRRRALAPAELLARPLPRIARGLLLLAPLRPLLEPARPDQCLLPPAVHGRRRDAARRLQRFRGAREARSVPRTPAAGDLQTTGAEPAPSPIGPRARGSGFVTRAIWTRPRAPFVSSFLCLAGFSCPVLKDVFVLFRVQTRVSETHTEDLGRAVRRARV